MRKGQLQVSVPSAWGTGRVKDSPKVGVIYVDYSPLGGKYCTQCSAVAINLEVVWLFFKH